MSNDFIFRSTALEHNIMFSAATMVDSVQVQNLTRGLMVTVPAGKTLRLTDEPNAIYSVEDNEYQIKIYPNPIQGTSTLSFYSPASGQTRVDVLALDGRRIDGTVNNIVAGENLYKLSLPKGAYFIKITGAGFSYAVRVLSQRPNDYTTEISFTGNYGQTSNRQKSPAATVSLYFNAGDRLLYKGYSGNNSNIITDIPSADKSMTFTFDECKDALGNYYATVKIGNQTWMVENLNTTKYLSGEQITELKDDAAWKATTTGAYCDNSNNPEFAKIYGKLYNWYAVNDSRKIAPKGWHIPTAEEWKALEDYLGGNTVAGGKLKETGTQHWTSPNNAATNETGFTAIPAGWRNYEGVSLTPGTQAGWWTSTQASATQGIARRTLNSSAAVLQDNTREKQFGYSIRCVKDIISLPILTTAAISNITNTSAAAGGEVLSDGGSLIIERGVCWSTQQNPTTNDNKTSDGTGSGIFSSTLSGLSENTNYYLRAYARNEAGTAYGEQKVFTTKGFAPVLETVTVTSITSNFANSGGNITSDGGAPITERGVCWSTSENPTVINNKTSDGTGTGMFTSMMTGLSPDLLYYARAYATNDNGTSYGTQVSFRTGNNTFTDIRDGRIYKMITIGTQVWMAENLKATQYLNGEQIPEIKEETSWKTTTSGARCDNSNNPDYANIYGKLYNWYAVNDSRTLAPKGWHIPTVDEWKTLEDYLGGSTIAGGKLKEATSQYWTSPNNGANNESGFTALPGGWRNYEGVSLSPGTQTGWWTSTPASATQAVAKRVINSTTSVLQDNTRENQFGYAIRCVKNITGLPAVTTTGLFKVTQNSAIIGGEITSDGGERITACGVCWSTSPNPTISDNHTNENPDKTKFASEITGLTINTGYYARAYATNVKGTVYGSEERFTASDFPTAIVDVTNPTTGKTWMDRNLGASRAATSSSDTEAYGDLYQWGRGKDGHEKRTSGITNTLSIGDSPEHGNFIITSSEPYDWRSTLNDNLWQGVNGINNPCPTGYRLPTYAELDTERASWSSQNSAGAFASPLKLPMAGIRANISGWLHNAGSIGYYWSGTVEGANAQSLYFNSSGANMNSDVTRAGGFSVRCIKHITSAPKVSTPLISSISYYSAKCSGNITDDGGLPVTEHGICWSTKPNPTIADSISIDVSGTNSFICSLTGLTKTTTYFVRAYATNSIGTSYGNELSFTTSDFNDVLNPVTGRTWMDRNLGASRAATSSSDTEAYGDLYQWGRGTDGHEKRTSGTTNSLSSSVTPGHGNFITSSSGNSDWRSTQNDNLWQGVNGVNNPCPNGYRLPTNAELDAERASWSSQNSAGAFASPLKLPVAGHRSSSNGSLFDAGSYGYYWSGTVYGTYAQYLTFSSSSAAMYFDNRSLGFSVRCLKE